jgi:hypothetical protein
MLKTEAVKIFTISISVSPEIIFSTSKTVEMLAFNKNGIKAYNKNSPKTYLKIRSGTYFFYRLILEYNLANSPISIIMRINPTNKFKF